MAAADTQLIIGDDPGADGVQQAADNADTWWWPSAMRTMRWLADTGQPLPRDAGS